MVYNEELHAKLLEVGKVLEVGVTHTLEEPFIKTIAGTLDFFGATREQVGLATFDLGKAKYKIWDALGMWYTGRLNADGELLLCLEKLIKLYIFQNHVGGWAWWLRGHDLEIEEPGRCEDCIESYETWQEEQKIAT